MTQTTAVNVNSNSDTVRRLDNITKVMMTVLILIPFLISFGSLWGLAEEYGVGWAMLYPLMIDGGLLIFKLLVLSASLRGETDHYSWGMAALLTVISIALNVAHVPADTANWLLAAFMFGLPPALILAAFVAVTRRVEGQARRETAVLTLADLERKQRGLQAQLGQLTKQRNEAEQATAVLAEDVKAETARLEAERERVQTEARQLLNEFNQWQANQAAKRAALEGEIATLEAQRARVGERSQAERKTQPKPTTAVSTPAPANQAQPEDIFPLVAENAYISQAAIARKLQMSEGWVSKQVRDLTGKGMLSRNGHGWEVKA
jgi:biotin operon repressor